jgi:hypothetical protein
MCSKSERPKMKIQTVKPHGNHNIFISFIEEAIMNPDFWDYVAAGRVEVSRPKDEYPSEEIRFLTKKASYFVFREKWDFHYVNEEELKHIREMIDINYMEVKE